MRAINPNTPIPQVSHQRHISFPLSTQTLLKPKPRYMVYKAEAERERKREKRTQSSVWNAEGRLPIPYPKPKPKEGGTNPKVPEQLPPYPKPNPTVALMVL